MDSRLADLQRQFELERLEVNLFRGQSRDTGSPQVFGGQVLGQALKAASATIDDGRICHSLHAYFLRRGDFNKPIVYSVDRSRDGGSFSARRVLAIQDGEQIFLCSASFQEPEPGLEYQASMPKVPPPEDLQPFAKPPAAVLEKLPEKLRRWLEIERPFEFRPVQQYNPLAPVACEPVRQIWMRAVDKLPDDDALHRCLIAYISDYWLLDTTTMPHGSSFLRGNLIMASIDHAIWFHRPGRVDDWLLYSLDSPSSSGARGFARGSLYSRSGVLVASTAQEGLIRLVKPAA
ncbi:MAG TPA: acyl-CoA thioesterase II [Steroidobacteraceae bacterium]|jgi:acyl-CoA thioesterase II|nr:acyl-CoA thioesterase II [Steroidobacteraceae bacterium]